VTCKSSNDEVNGSKILYSDLMNGGCLDSKDWTTCWVPLNEGKKAEGIILGHCRESQAAMVFMFMATVLLLVGALMGFLRRRKGY
jgi:hypothetical protein